jgi:hypothetical protein
MAKGKKPGNQGIAIAKQVPVKVGSRRIDAVGPGGADQLGQAMAKRQAVQPLVSGRPSDKTDLGNFVAANTKAGPGGSRTVLRSGQQSQHGPANYGEAGGSPDPRATRQVGASSSLGRDPSKWGNR